MRHLMATSTILLTLLLLPSCASWMKDRQLASEQDTTRQVFEAILKNLKSYSNVQGKERLMDRRVLQWWEDSSNIPRVAVRFKGRHNGEMLESFREQGLIEGFAAPREREGFPPENWLLERDEKTAAISLSSPRVNENSGVEVLCWIETVFDYRDRGGRRLGFFTLISFTVECREDKWEVIKRETILIT